MVQPATNVLNVVLYLFLKNFQISPLLFGADTLYSGSSDIQVTPIKGKANIIKCHDVNRGSQIFLLLWFHIIHYIITMS